VGLATMKRPTKTREEQFSGSGNNEKTYKNKEKSNLVGRRAGNRPTKTREGAI